MYRRADQADQSALGSAGNFKRTVEILHSSPESPPDQARTREMPRAGRRNQIIMRTFCSFGVASMSPAIAQSPEPWMVNGVDITPTHQSITPCP
jgi:hypothetical protein